MPSSSISATSVQAFPSVFSRSSRHSIAALLSDPVMSLLGYRTLDLRQSGGLGLVKKIKTKIIYPFGETVVILIPLIDAFEIRKQNCVEPPQTYLPTKAMFQGYVRSIGRSYFTFDHCSDKLFSPLEFRYLASARQSEALASRKTTSMDQLLILIVGERSRML